MRTYESKSRSSGGLCSGRSVLGHIIRSRSLCYRASSTWWAIRRTRLCRRWRLHRWWGIWRRTASGRRGPCRLIGTMRIWILRRRGMPRSSGARRATGRRGHAKGEPAADGDGASCRRRRVARLFVRRAASMRRPTSAAHTDTAVAVMFEGRSAMRFSRSSTRSLFLPKSD